MRLAATVCAALVVLTGSWPGVGAEPTDGGNSVFQSDPSFSTRVTIDQPFATVQEVLDGIRTQAGVALRAEPGIHNQNVTVLVKDKPAADVLATLGNALGYRWRLARESQKDRPVYEIYEDTRSREKRADRLRSTRRTGLDAIRKECLRKAGAAGVPPKEARRRLEELGQLLREPDLTPEQRTELADEQQWLQSRPAWTEQGALLGIFANLLPSLRLQLETGITIRLSSTRREGMLPLPQASANALLAMRAMSTERDTAWIKWAQRNSRSLEVRLQCQVLWLGRTARVSVKDCVLPTMPGFAPESVGMMFTVALPLPKPELPSEAEADAAGLRKPVQIALPSKKPIPNQPLSYYPVPTLMDVLKEVHRMQPDIGIVGDAYLRPFAFVADSRPVALRSLLDRATNTAGCSWRWDGRGCVVIRSLTPETDRVAAVPATVLRSLASRSEVGHRLRLADYVWFVQQLSDDQVRANFQSWPAGPTLVLPHAALNRGMLADARNELRLLSLLSKEQERRVAVGLPILGAELSSVQWRILAAALNDDDSQPMGSRLIEVWSGRELATMSVQVGIAESSTSGERASVTFSYRHPDREPAVRELKFSL